MPVVGRSGSLRRGAPGRCALPADYYASLKKISHLNAAINLIRDDKPNFRRQALTWLANHLVSRRPGEG